MTLNEFKDALFDVLNESDEWCLRDIQADEQRNCFYVSIEEGTWFVIEYRERNSPCNPFSPVV
jgi:hypothetical protein